MGWYEDSFRKLFFDFHNHSTAAEIAKDFDAEAWADQLVKANVQAVSQFARDLYGWNYYLKGSIGWPHPNLPSGLDMLGEVVDACHRHGIKVIAYYYVTLGERLSVARPDWLMRDALGLPRAMSCILTLVTEEHYLPQLEEIAHNYEIDGFFLDFSNQNYNICFCETCKREFREDAGLELPLNQKSPNWGTYLEWKFRRIREIHRKMIDAIHKGRPDTLVCFNYRHAIEYPQKPLEGVGFLSMDIYSDYQLFDASMNSRFWVTSGKPFDILNSALLGHWWYDWGVKTAVTLKQECATIIANGGRTWIGYQMYPQFKVEPAVMSQLSQGLAFVKERENLCKDAKSMPYIAISHSTRWPFTHEPDYYVEPKHIKGAHKVLLESGLHYHIITDEDLEENMDQYKVVILSDQRYISSRLTDAIRKFVSEGGGLIATCLTGTEDEDLKSEGRFMLEDLFGASLEGEYPQTHAYIEVKDERLKHGIMDMPIQVYGKFVYVNPKTSEVLARLRGLYLRADGKYLLESSPPGADTGYPSITLNRFGKGNVAYISGDVFSGYLLRNQWNIKHIVKNLLNLVLPEKLIEIDCPDVVEVVATEKENLKMIHLINHYGERAVDKHRMLQYVTVDLVPIYNIKVRVRCDRTPKDVRLEPEGKKLKWRMEGNMLEVRVPKLEVHSCIVIK